MNTWRGSDKIITFWDLKEFLELHHSRIFIQLKPYVIEYKIPKILGRFKHKRIIKKLIQSKLTMIIVTQIGYLKRDECRKEKRITIKQMDTPEYLDCERPI